MHAIGVKQPSISACDFVRRLSQHQDAKRVAVERKKSEGRKGPTGRVANRFGDRFTERNVAAAFLIRDSCDDLGILLDAAIEFALKRIIRGRVFSDRTERAKPDIAWLASDASNGVTGRRCIAAKWNTALTPRAGRRAGRMGRLWRQEHSPAVSAGRNPSRLTHRCTLTGPRLARRDVGFLHRPSAPSEP